MIPFQVISKNSCTVAKKKWRKTHTFWTNLATWFTQILPKQNTDFVHFIYCTNILNWPLNLAQRKKKRYLVKALTALWSNGIQSLSDWQCSDPMAYRHRQIDSTLIQWHTVIVRLTALWSNGIQASSDWQRSDPMAYRHRQIDSALIQWYTGIIRLTALWSNGTQASSDWQRSRAMMLGIQWGGSHISGWLCPSLSQPCYNVVLIGAPSAGGALGHRLARLCLEMVLLVNTEMQSDVSQ